MENDITGVSDIPKDRENAVNMEKDGIILSLKQENEKLLAELHVLRNQMQTMEFFKTAADYFPHVIALYDAERKFVFVNSYAIELSGLAYNDFIGRRDEDIFPPSVTRCYLPALQKAIETLKPQTKECTIKFMTKRTLILTFIPMLNEDGQLYRVMSNSFDITERKNAETELAARELMFRKVWESSFDGMRLMNNKGVIVKVNEAFCSMVGMKKEELEGKIFTKIYKSPHEEILKKAIYRMQTRTVVPRYVEKFDLWNGKSIWFEVSNNLLRISHSSPVLLSIFRDISQRKLAEDRLNRTIKKLEESNRELEQFAYIASHDLQEPLRMVSNYTQLLAKRYQSKLDETGREFINFAVNGAMRMQSLIKDLLAYSRVTTKARPFEPTDCNEILRVVLLDLKLAIEESKAVITSAPLPEIMADPTQFRQLLQNLLSNSMKFRTERPPEIRISAEARDNEWLFKITDNGIGIDPQYFERIFMLFQRLHDSGTYPGTGIGLAICKKIVERHGGRMYVESEPGRGTTFYFTIPK
ncbi:MAG: PAS domain S-box protein [Ignavibacteria bacterium]|jgi:PAS domain S-box-containing protein|nr:PAS domain S-box protein [Ignavibacteria bacterium]MCU7501191.1 PAS domain S-box protein [Ignavibacteria bacterium]MCU7513403.1 PAS domain S-box protein [Ignavibacteria bacterium]MCU7522174.1 PAS domain S-box protein [Ignavibacteria bacterium]MCU7525105.1 PAS domain S-box protein [Ignavibacteria bacterium]